MNEQRLAWKTSRLWFRLAGTVAAGLMLTAACVQGVTRPKPASGGTLALGAERGTGAEQASGPVKVAFASPQGVVGVVTELSVVFDRPVHPVGVVSDGPPPFRLTPEVPGAFRWVGSRAAVFTPTERLPLATSFRVEVPAGLQAIDGTRLAAPYTFELETRRPTLLSSSPSDGQRGLGLDSALRLEFDQRITLAALRAAAKLEQVSGGRRAAVSFEVRPDPLEPRALIVTPKRALLPNSEVTLTLASTLRGTEGSLPADAERVITFRTYDPLQLLEVSCARRDENAPCDAGSSVGLSFNNSVDLRSLAGKVHVTPDVGLKLTRPGEEATSSYVELPGRFEAGQSYRIQLDPGVTDQFGQTLSKPLVASARFADYRPRVDIGAVGRNFAAEPLSVPVASRNVASFELLTAALSPRDVLSWREAQRPGPGNLKDLDWLAKFAQVRVDRVTPRSARNQIAKLDLDTAKVLGAKARGTLAIGARYRLDRDDWDAPPNMKVLNLSDLGISAKLSRFGSLVWVTDRKTNTPLSGAAVDLVMPERPDRTYTTDVDGVAHIPAADFAPNLDGDSPEARALLVVRTGNDSAFAAVSEYLEGWRLDVPTDFSGELRPYGVLFSDRGIYRPGDDVMLKGVVRKETATGNALPGEVPVQVTLRSPSGDEVATQPVVLTGHGTFSAKLHIPSGAPLGPYSASASGLGRERFLQDSIEVAEYRAVELKVAASAERPAYVRGDTAQLDVKADYLFGAAASGLSATLSVSRQPTWFSVPGADDFVTSASAYYDALSETPPVGELRRETRKLDGFGRVAWSEKLDLPGQRGTELLRLDAEVTDVSRQTVAASTSALVHPASFYVGVKAPSDGFVDAPGVVSPQIATFAPDGRRVAVKSIVVELIERRYTWAREASGDDYRGVSKVVDRQVARCEVSTLGQAQASCPLSVPAAGYYLVVARAKDERGRGAEAATFLYAAGAGEPTWQDNERRAVELVLDKKSYSVGQRARVLVKSPYREAEALITVERAGVYQSFRRVLRGAAPSFEVPVTEELRPNAFIGVHLLPRRSGKKAAIEAGSYRVGYASLAVSSESHRLAVRIAPNKADYRPGENIDVSLQVKDAHGAAAPSTEVTLYAADEGVLSLIDYRTPDPLATFTADRPLQVATLESRDAEGRILLEALGGRDKGRDGGGGGESDARRDFRQTAYFNPRILTDARGEAKVSFKLPEGLTTYRLMAVAVGKQDNYGLSQERVTTSKPLMARPALPRFVRAGDSFEAGVIVSKKRLGAGKVRVSMGATGLQATGAASREIEVPADGSLEVRFPLRAEHPGTASVRFEVSAGSERDVVTQTFAVALPMTPETAAFYGETNQAQLEKLGELSAARDDAGGLSVALSSTALGGLGQAALDLIEYPYDCTEQLSSRILPLVALGELSAALGFSLPPDARKRAESAVAEVLARQQGDGGFAMWPESGRSVPWVSPYATLALVRAARAGIALPKPALERAREYLRGLARGESRPEGLATSALALDVLGELGYPDAGGVTRLFARGRELPLFGKALLLHAAIGAKLASDVPAELTRQLEASLHLVGDRALVTEEGGAAYTELFDSTPRTQAMVLRALSARGGHPLLSALARGLLDSRKRGKFATTQEGAWALLALDDYRRVGEPSVPNFVATLTMGERQLAQTHLGRGSQATRLEVPLRELLAAGREGLLFEKRGAGKLFYEGRLRYVRRELPREALDAGIFIEKSLHSVNANTLGKGGVGAPPGVAKVVAAGELVQVDLTLVTPAPRKYVVVDDALPAGLEAVDPRLSTTADWLKNDAASEASPCADCSGTEGSGSYRYDRTEVRDDRVLFFIDELPPGLFHFRYLARATTLGQFVVPPSRAEEMYQPEVFGRTGAYEVTIR